MQNHAGPLRSAFRDNYLAAIGIAALVISSFSVSAQRYQYPNPGTWGTISHRPAADSTFFFPTGCGIPIDSTWLFSQGFTGAGQKLKMAAQYYDSCGHHMYLWDPSLQLWHIADSTSGGGSTDTTSLSTRINLKVDSLTQSNDTTYYWVNGTRRFGGKGKISLATLLSVLGYTPLAGSDTVYLHNLAAGKRDVTDTLYAHFLMTRLWGYKIADSLGKIIGGKQDSSARFNFYAKKDGGRGINIARFADSSGYFKGLIDSLDFHLLLNADSTITGYVNAHDTSILETNYGTDTMRIRLNNAIAAAGGGLTAIADNKQLSNISGASAVPTAHEIPIVMVKDYTVSDSTTDDLLGVRAAARRCADLGGCILQFPAGKGTRVTDTILFKSTVHITGVGGVVGTKYTTPIGGKIVSGSIIWGGGANKSVFVVDSTSTGGRPVFTIDNVAIISTQTPGTPTAGSAIVIRGFVQRTMIRNCTISGFWVDIDIHSGFYWTIADNWIGEPVQSCVRINDSVRTDTGDWGIYNNQFIAGNFNGSAYGIEWRSGGGLKVYGNKFDSQLFTVSTMFKHSIYLVSTVDPTSDVQISGNSIEDYQISGIFDSCVNRVAHHIFTDNHTSGFVSTGPAIDVYNAWYVQITGNQWTAWAGISAPSMRFANCIGVMAWNNTVVAYTSAYASTNSSINRMDYIRTGGEGVQASESKSIFSMRSAAGGPEIDLINDSTGSFPQTAINMYNDNGVASNKGASLVHASSTATAPYGNAYYMYNFDNGPIWFATNNVNRGGVTAGGNWLLGTTTDPGFGAKLWINGKLGVQTMDSVAVQTGGCVFRDAISGLYKLGPCGGGGGSTSPGGSNGQVQVNTSGAFAGYAGLTYDFSNTRLYLGSGSATSPQLFNMTNSVNGGVGWSVENGNTGTSARQENIMVESSTKLVGHARFNSTYTGNFAGTSLPLAEGYQIYTYSGGLGNKPIVINGTPIVSLPGVSAGNYGTRLDASGFRVGLLSTMHTANTYPFQVDGIVYKTHDTTNYKVAALDGTGKLFITDWPTFGAGATTPAGSTGWLQYNNGGTPNVFGADNGLFWDGGNHRLSIGSATPLSLTNLNVARSSSGLIGIGITNANTSGSAELFAGEDATHFHGIGKKGSAVAGNWSGTNVAIANNSYWYTFGSASGQNPIFINSNPFIVQVGQTTTLNGLRIDGTGIRIGPSSGLGTANTVGFEFVGAGKIPGYGSGTKTGTPTFNLQVDASGNIIEGSATLTNPMTTLGDMVYGGASGAFARLAGNTTSFRKFVMSLGSAGVATAPIFDVLTTADIPNNAANTSGTAANLSGTPALPNGTTATTQAATDNTTKIASTAFVQSIVASGTYTPTLTNTTNVTTSSLPSDICTYMKAGNIVHVKVVINVTPTATSTNTVLTISLPITVASAVTQLFAGTGWIEVPSVVQQAVLVQIASTTTATLTFGSGSISSGGKIIANFDYSL